MLTYLSERLRDENAQLFRRLWDWLESKGYELCEYFHDFGCPCDCPNAYAAESSSIAA